MLGDPVQARESFHRHHNITKQLIESELSTFGLSCSCNKCNTHGHFLYADHMQARKLQEHSLTEVNFLSLIRYFERKREQEKGREQEKESLKTFKLT